MIIFIFMLLLFGVLIFVVLVDSDELFNKKKQCSKCKTYFPIREMHIIVHGMGPESDCWNEYFCQECGAPDCRHKLTAHNVR